MSFVRLIVERLLLRFRLAWFLGSVLSAYLTLVIVLFTLGQRQLTLGGGLATCQWAPDASSGAGVYQLTMRQQPTTHLRLDPVGFTPALPANLCQAPIGAIAYTQTSLGEPYTVNRVTLTNRRGRPMVYANAAGRDFVAARNDAAWVRGGGMALLSGALLVVGAWWQRIRRVLGMRKGQRLADDPPTHLSEVVRAQVAEGMSWLSTLPWNKGVIFQAGASVAAGGDAATALANVSIASSLNADQQHEQLTHGLELIYGWGGDETRLVSGVTAVLGLSPALAYTGASAAALQLAAYAPVAWAPAGARMALAYAVRALSEDTIALPDARIAYIQALASLGVAGDADRARQAAMAYQTLAELAPTHPRLAPTQALVAIAAHEYDTASVALQAALAQTPALAEAPRLRAQLAWVARHHGASVRIKQVSRALWKR
ncbi:MAG TPA: hypothetical protein VKQ36_16580 [Ktedonobacterales bacterium]|nr:hypothetical protein [Ktedonobacterales bacterium]